MALGARHGPDNDQTLLLAQPSPPSEYGGVGFGVWDVHYGKSRSCSGGDNSVFQNDRE